MRSYLNQAMTVMLATLVVAGCSSESPGGASSNTDADTGSVPDTAGFWPDSAGFPTDETGPGPTDSGSTDAAPSCVPTGEVDEPDDAFKDTNCDGIDGDKSRAIFVSPEGSDAAAGTLEAPVRTLANATQRAGDAGKDVYVCNGTYPEAIVLSKSVRLFGGYDCKAGWKRTLVRGVIAPSKGTPVTVQGVAGAGVRLDRMELGAPDGVAPGQSSIGIFASESVVTITNGAIKAGVGADGESPVAASPVTTTATKGVDANEFGTTTCTSVCAGGMPGLACKTPVPGAMATTATPACEGRGGRGGDGAVSKWSGKEYLATAGAGGGPATVGAPARSVAGSGLDGLPGSVGKSGVSATAGLGEITAAGYVAKNSGSSGEAGGAGGGGSGGWGHSAGSSPGDICASSYWNGGAGGEGGYGGCGGAPGAGGGAGGASIAVLSWKSTVTVSKTTLDTLGGGRGGNGAAGVDGQPGGIGGKGGEGTAPGFAGYAGGAGGRGGRGGSGGAGGGGPSFGVLHVGTAPVLVSVTTNIGGGGAGGSSSSGVGAVGAFGETYDANPK